MLNGVIMSCLDTVIILWYNNITVGGVVVMDKIYTIYDEEIHGNETIIKYTQDEKTGKKQYYILVLLSTIP